MNATDNQPKGKKMPEITITIPSSSAVRCASGVTIAEAVESALKSAAIIEALGLGGTAGYKWHGLEVSAPVERIYMFNGAEQRCGKWDRTITAKWQAMQTLPQEQNGDHNPVKTVEIRISHDSDFANEPAVKWSLAGGKLVAA